MIPVFVGSAFVAKYPTGGGNFWVPLQYLLGLRALGVEAYWLELVWPQGKERAEPTSFSRVKRVLGPLGPQFERRLDDDLHFAHLKACLMVDANEVHITQGPVQASFASSYDPAL